MATLVQAVRLALHYGEEHLGVTDVLAIPLGRDLPTGSHSFLRDQARVRRNAKSCG